MNHISNKDWTAVLNQNVFKISCQSGFSLTEVLTVVLIIGVLTSVALPQYMRSVERARAAEAMSAIKAINDSIYAYYQDKENCPQRFSQLAVTLPSDATSGNGTSVSTKNFRFDLAGAADDVPGTSCKGVSATRLGNTYQYTIWNPYTRGTSGKSLALQCNATNDKSIAVCESLGLYREEEESSSEEE